MKKTATVSKLKTRYIVSYRIKLKNVLQIHFLTLPHDMTTCCSGNSLNGKQENGGKRCEKRQERRTTPISHLAGDTMGTELSEAEWRRDLPEEGDDVDMLDPPLGIRVVLGPQPDKLI